VHSLKKRQTPAAAGCQDLHPGPTDRQLTPSRDLDLLAGQRLRDVSPSHQESTKWELAVRTLRSACEAP